MKLVKGGCPICNSDVTGDSKHLYFCRQCNILFREEHLQLSKEEIAGKIKAKLVEQYAHTEPEKLQLEILKKETKKRKKKHK